MHLRPALALTTLTLSFFFLSLLPPLLDHEEENKHHKAATHLLDEAHEALELFDHEKRVWIQDLLGEIQELSHKLKTEESLLNVLIAEMELVKKNDFFWFLDVVAREAVDDIQLKINVQQRVVDNISDDISVHWRKLKPLYGLKSKMFLSEAVMSVFRVLIDVFAFFVPSPTISLPALLLLGPVFLFVCITSLTIGVLLLPYAVGLLGMIWAMKFPAVIIQYNPTPAEFSVAYGVGVAVIGAVVISLLSVFKPVQLTKFQAN